MDEQLLPLQLEPPELAGALTLIIGIRYALIAGVAWLLGYVWFRKRWLHRKIVQKFPPRSDVRRELLHSLRTVVIFALIATASLWAAHHGWTQIYWRISDHSWTWWFASIGLTILLHDAWFYWTHRLMHHPALFKFFHKTHHLSKNPTPWAAFAFSPAEAVVQAGIFPLAAIVMPLNPHAFAVFLLWQMVFNVIGHTGYEYNPRWFMRSWFRFIINTPTNHAMHHESFKGNFGLYFNYWDRLMGTNQEDYEKRFMEVTSRSKGV